MLELLAFLLSPLPRLEDPSQVGELTSPPDGRGVCAWDKGVGTHGRQPLHFLSCFSPEKEVEREREEKSVKNGILADGRRFPWLQITETT